MAKKKITLEVIFAHLQKMDERMERGFGAVAEDIADIKNKMASKDQVFALHTQIHSIETELRASKRLKLITRVADLEEKAFGASRA